MEIHLKILGILFIVSGVLSILFAGVVVFVFLGSGLISGDFNATAILTTIGLFLASFSFITGIAEIISGWGLLDRKKWSRILAIVMGIINLLAFPFGTALGVYTLFVLFNPESEKYLIK
jgi:hypothetical protein